MKHNSEKISSPFIEPIKNNRENEVILSDKANQEIVNLIKSSLKKQPSLKNPPGYWQNASDIANKQLKGKISSAAIVKIANKLGIKGEKFRGENGHLIKVYSPEDIEKIINDETAQKLLSLEEPPKYWQNATDIANKQLKGKIPSVTVCVTRIANKLGIKGEEFRGKNGHPTKFYSPEDIEKIINDETAQKLLSLEEPPKYWQNATDIANKQLKGKISSVAIVRIANKLGIKGEKFRGENGHLIKVYSPEDIKIIINNEMTQKLLSLEEPPKYWQNADNIASRQLKSKVSGTHVTSIANKLDIKGEEFRGENGRPTKFYSPEDIEKIINDETAQKLLSLEEPPKYWQNATDIANKQLKGKISSAAIAKIANKFGIKGEEFRGKNGNPTKFYSPEERDQIIEEVENNAFRTSFPEQAVAFYLQQVGINIQQNIRPNWMKNPDTKYNLEVDIFIPFDNPPPPGIGIEYDGVFWHKNPNYDARKNTLSRRKGIEIIHIRESGCPDLPTPSNGLAIPCVYRNDNNSNTSLNECIKQVLTNYIGVNLPEEFIDVSRDQTAILGYMKASEKIIQNTNNLTEDELEDGIFQIA